MKVYVYQYGCGAPLSGQQYAEIEHERCTMLWDQLVELERTVEREMLYRARADDARLEEIGRLTEQLTVHLGDSPKDTAARSQRRELYAEQRALLTAWRKAHKEIVREFERRRQAAVKFARQQTDAWWPNYNRVLQAYEAARQTNRKLGRRLRLHDESRDDGVLAFQIQRTRTGLGASADELKDGSVPQLQIGRVDPRAYDKTVGRCERQRLCATAVEMQVDAEGHTIRLPIWMHRPLPDRCRVKAVQLTKRVRGQRPRWQLCLSVAVEGPFIADQVSRPTPLALDWIRGVDGALIVLRGPDRQWTLPEKWWRKMERLRKLDRYVSDCREAEIPVRRGVLIEVEEGRANLLRQRRDLYRLIARDAVARYQSIEMDERDLSAIATAERGDDSNSMRHMVGPHYLRAEILHQATKAGVPVVANGRVVNASESGKSSAWKRRKSAKAERSRTVAQVDDSPGA